MIEIKIKENEFSYPVFIEDYDISELKNKINEFTDNKNFIVVISQKVYKLYKKSLNFDKNKCFILKDGEKEKNFDNYKRILDFCFKNKLTRKDAIIAIGGGVVGDLTGFVASTYLRGIDFIQVPTTLLACVDSSVGGKVAINTKYGKNLVGNFYQPKAVFINLNFLKTLSLNDYKSGLGEVIKYGFIEKSCGFEDYNFLNFLNENSTKIIDKNLSTIKKMIEICINLKKSVVEQDEKEQGLRKILNFGHTYGHAVEKYTKYKYSHGQCVVFGIVFAFNLALKNNIIDKSYEFFMQNILEKFNFTKIPNFEVKKLLPFVQKDKKSEKDTLCFVLPVNFATVKEVYFDKDFNKIVD